jgi:hypothetical protein
MSFEIDIEESGLSAMRALANPSQFRKDVIAGLRYVTPGLKKVIAKEIGTRYALPAARIKDDVRDPKYSDDSITVRFNRVPPSLRAYGGRPIKAKKTARGVGIPIGIKYKVFKGKQEKRDSVFWLQVSNVPFPGIPFRRTGTASTQIEALYGPSIGSIFTGKSAFGEEIRQKTVDYAQVQFIKGVERSFQRRARGF